MITTYHPSRWPRLTLLVLGLSMSVPHFVIAGPPTDALDCEQFRAGVSTSATSAKTVTTESAQWTLLAWAGLPKLGYMGVEITSPSSTTTLGTTRTAGVCAGNEEAAQDAAQKLDAAATDR